MRYKRLIAVLLTAIFLLGAVVPAIADDGKHPRIFEAICKDHPWQDESANGKGKSAKRPLGFVIGPLAFTVDIAIPFTQKPSQAPPMPANNTTTQKNVEKRK
ncbi:MAG: hypothetical protein NT028_06055 [candidate division Zixibacteria bacterium]|jgi:hypothetical protein|nr:hypothetical protein [candidate division Zixibacteria bacterium]